MPFPIHDTSRRGRVLNASFPYFRSPKYWYIDQLVCFPWFFLTSSRQVHGCMDTKLGYGPFHIKCKVHPTTCHEATEGEYRYSCTLSLTSVLDEGGWVVNATFRPLYSRELFGNHCVGGRVGSRAGIDGCEKSCPPPRFDPRTVQPEVSRYKSSTLFKINSSLITFLLDAA